MDFIDLQIGSEGYELPKKIKVFCLNNDDDKTLYESLLNDESTTIIKEHGPTFDKMGRAMLIVIWEEGT